MALWEQLHTTSTTINWRTLGSPKSQQFISRGISLSPSEQTQSTHCCLQPGVTDFPVWKTVYPPKAIQKQMQLSVPVTALAVGRRGTETLCITTDFTQDRGENLFCFRHPLKQRADPSHSFQLSSHNYWKQLEFDCSVKWVSLKWYSWNKSLWVNSTLFFSSTFYAYKNHTVFIFY